jgi:hypothetical protein
VGENIRRTALAQERRLSNEATRPGPIWQQPCPRNQKRYIITYRVSRCSSMCSPLSSRVMTTPNSMLLAGSVHHGIIG